jgi:hypothetical protein
VLGVSCHHIGRSYVDFLPVALAEGVKARMFKKASDNADYLNIICFTFNFGQQASYASHYDLYAHSRHRGLRQLVDNIKIGKGIYFYEY